MSSWGKCVRCGGICHEGRCLCDYCLNFLAAESAWRNDTVSDSLVCPWCGEQQDMQWDEQQEDASGFFMPGGEQFCIHCGKRFAYEADVIVEYSSWRLAKDMPNGWHPTD